ncbi:MAG: hypothetical protein H7123_03920 [Thermoleophilia bacterium]|nr:hypothetical protein [Thermoleophilia bacterium]
MDSGEGKIMGSSIGTELNALVNSTVQRALFGSNSARTTTDTAGAGRGTPFAAELIKRYDVDADGKLDGKELQAALTAPGSGDMANTMVQNSDANSVDALWQRAQLKAIADGNGPGDAILKQMDAADDYQHRHKSNNLFDF